MLRILIVVLALVGIHLMSMLYYGEGGLVERRGYLAELEIQRSQNEQLNNRNRALTLGLQQSKKKMSTVEGTARSELGMIKKGEEFYWVVPEE